MSVKRYDFDCYAFYDSARLNVQECDDGDYVLHSDYAALEARHNALRESIHKAMERTVGCDKKQTDNQLIADVAYLKRISSDYFKASAEWRCRAFAAEQRNNALREAVAWERECCQDIRPLFAWSGLYLRHGEGYLDGVAEDLRAIQDAASAEVDRLLGEREG